MVTESVVINEYIDDAFRSPSLMPSTAHGRARVRGWTDLVINGSFWVGAAMGAGYGAGLVWSLDKLWRWSGESQSTPLPADTRGTYRFAFTPDGGGLVGLPLGRGTPWVCTLDPEPRVVQLRVADVSTLSLDPRGRFHKPFDRPVTAADIKYGIERAFWR